MLSHLYLPGGNGEEKGFEEVKQCRDSLLLPTGEIMVAELDGFR